MVENKLRSYHGIREITERSLAPRTMNLDYCNGRYVKLPSSSRRWRRLSSWATVGRIGASHFILAFTPAAQRLHWRIVHGEMADGATRRAA